MEQTTKKKKPAGARRKVRRRRTITGTTVVSVILLAVVGIVALAVYQTLAARAEASKPIEGVEQFPALERGHVQGAVAYAQTPPVGGPHEPAWQNCGAYTQPLQNENAVHSLEHGAVWITYRPDLPAAEIQQLQDLARQSGYRLLSPYPDLPSPIVISAWGYQLKLERADDPRLMRFIQKYELSPLAPEPGAPCTGGVGQPG